MAVTRYLYSDATFLTFTLGANTTPNTTNSATIITGLYKDAYKAAYGDLAKYNATDTNVADGILEAWFDIIDNAFIRIVEEISDYYSADDQSSAKKPFVHLKDDEIVQICFAVGAGFRFPSREDQALNETGDTID